MRLDRRILPTCGVLLLFATSTFAIEDANKRLKREAVEAVHRLAERLEKGEAIGPVVPRDSPTASKAESALSVARSAIVLGDLETARKALRTATSTAETIKPKDRFVSPHPLVRIGETWAELGNQAAARETFFKAEKAIAALPRELNQYDEWLKFGPLVANNLEPEDARRILSSYRRLLDTSKDYIISTYHREGLVDLALLDKDFDRVFQMVEELAHFKQVADLRARVNAAGFIVDRFRHIDLKVSRDQKIAAAKLLEKLKTIILSGSDGAQKNHSLNVLGATQARIGLVEEGIKTLLEIDPKLPGPIGSEEAAGWNQAAGFDAIAFVQLKAGDQAGAAESGRKALAILSRIDNPPLTARPLDTTIAILARAGDPESALKGVERLEEFQGDPLWLSAKTYRQVADAFVLKGQAELARKLDRRSLRLGVDMLKRANDKGKTPFYRFVGDPFTLVADIAEAHFRLGDRVAAIRAIGELPVADRDLARAKVAEYRASAGDATTALELLRAMTDRIAADPATVNAAAFGLR